MGKNSKDNKAKRAPKVSKSFRDENNIPHTQVYCKGGQIMGLASSLVNKQIDIEGRRDSVVCLNRKQNDILRRSGGIFLY